MEDTLLVHPTAQGLYEVFEKMPFEEQEKFIKLIPKCVKGKYKVRHRRNITLVKSQKQKY